MRACVCVRVCVCGCQLCALKSCRHLLRANNTYVILRELHSSEQNSANCVAVENLISLLISDEPPEDNLNELVIPDDIAAKLHAAHDEKSPADN